MPPKTVTCAICGAEVTKAQTLDLIALGLEKSGRGCRQHQTVMEATAAQQALSLTQSSQKEALRQKSIDRCLEPLVQVLITQSEKYRVLTEDLIFKHFVGPNLSRTNVARAIYLANERGPGTIHPETCTKIV